MFSKINKENYIHRHSTFYRPRNQPMLSYKDNNHLRSRIRNILLLLFLENVFSEFHQALLYISSNILYAYQN